MRAFGASVVLGLLASCGSTEGQLLYAVDGGGDGGVALEAAAGAGGAAGAVGVAGAGGVAGAAPPFIAQDDPWQYQLVGQVNPALDAQLFVVDLFNVPQSVIDRLHAQGKLAFAYLSAGTFEPFRDDADNFPEDAIGRALEAYPDESWLDVRHAAVRELMAARLDLARQKEFDGVVPTSLVAYLADSGFNLSAEDQTQYTVWLSQQVRQRGLRVGMSGDFGRVSELSEHFDFGVHFGCVARGDCAVLSPFMAAGKPVLDVETTGALDQVCSRAAGYRVNAILKPSGLGSEVQQCP
jgi:hypothetical protein